MYLLISAVVLAVLTLEGQAQHVPCCLPERWHSVIHQTLRFSRKDSPTWGYRSAYMEYAYDYPNRRLAARVHNEFPDYYLRFVLDFNQDRAYFIKEDGCRYRDFRAREFARACISESASYQGEFFMGLNQITYYRWYVFSEEVHAIVDVTSDNCVPGFAREHYENDLYSTHIDRIYANVTTELTDESIFEEPTDCTAAPDLSFFDTSDEGIAKMHAFHAIPTILSKPQEKKTHKKPLGL